MRKIHRTVLGSVLLALTLFAGCFSSKYTLIKPEDAKVDRALVGNYDMTDARGQHISLVVRNLDDRSYYVEIQSADDPRPSRYTAFIARIKSAVFAELREMDDTGAIPEQWALLRIDPQPDRLTIRQLSDEFFKNQTIESNAQLAETVEKNLDNEAMYDAQGALTANRVKP